MIMSTGTGPGSDHSFTIISQSTFVVDISGDKKCTRAISLALKRCHRFDIQWGSLVAWHVEVSSFKHNISGSYCVYSQYQ